MRRCSQCKTMKALDEFTRDVNTRDGLNGRCKSCTRQRARDYRARNRARNLAAQASA